MRTDAESSGARVKKKKRSSEHSKRHGKPAEGEWKQFTSPDGHPYYYNSVTKESRWELPTESEIPVRSKHRRPKGSSKQVELEGEGDTHQEQAPSSNEKKKKRLESAALDRQEPNDTPKPKNAMFQKLQASLEVRFDAMNGPMMGMGRPPPMLNIRREEEEYTGGATAVSEMKSQSLEEQYEAETAGMSAAERLRFLRKKRQENMMTKRDSVVGDDFMAEVANNMKKKEATRKPLEKKTSNTVPSWKEQEEAEEERKRRQMQAEIEAKEQEEARKEREQQAAAEREQRREQERAEQLALEQRRQDERKQRQAEESHQTQEKEKKRKKRKSKKEEVSDSADQLEEQSFDYEINNTDKTGVAGTLERDQISGDELPDESLDVSSSEHLKHRRRSRSRGSKNGVLNLSVQQSKQATNTGGGSLPELSAVSGEGGEDAAQSGKQRKREERRAQKLRQQELSASSSRASVTPESPRRNSTSSANGHKEEPSTRSTSSIESEEEIRAREKQLRRERRRMAEVEAAFAAQNLGNTGDQGVPQLERDRSDGRDSHGGGREGRSSSSNGSSYPGGSMDGQQPAGQAQFSGGMYPPYPYMMIPPPAPPPPPPSIPYGYYYPYMQPPPMMPMYPPGMVGVPPGYQIMPPTPPPSMNGMGTPSAMVPYGADSTLASFGAMYGAPELSRCDCCKGIGIGLVEKNGVCAHCNRLKLAFIVDSVQMRLRCSVCGGWGFQLLQANGMCEHCTRQSVQKSLATNDAARRRSSVAAPRGTSVPLLAPPRRNSTGNSKSGVLDDVDWDTSSSDDSDWDE